MYGCMGACVCVCMSGGRCLHIFVYAFQTNVSYHYVVCVSQIGNVIYCVVNTRVGTNVEQGIRILKESDVDIITANDLDDAAYKAAQSILKA